MDYPLVCRFKIEKVIDEKKQTVLVSRLSDGYRAVAKRKWLRNLSQHEEDAGVYVPASRPARIRLEYFVIWSVGGTI